RAAVDGAGGHAGFALREGEAVVAGPAIGDAGTAVEAAGAVRALHADRVARAHALAAGAAVPIRVAEIGGEAKAHCAAVPVELTSRAHHGFGRGAAGVGAIDEEVAIIVD